MTAVYRRSSDAMSAEVGDDVVALHAVRGFCYGMEQVTADVWRLLEQPSDLDSLVARLTADYDVSTEQCRADIAELLERLQREGLVEEVAA